MVFYFIFFFLNFFHPLGTTEGSPERAILEPLFSSICVHVAGT